MFSAPGGMADSYQKLLMPRRTPFADILLDAPAHFALTTLSIFEPLTRGAAPIAFELVSVIVYAFLILRHTAFDLRVQLFVLGDMCRLLLLQLYILFSLRFGVLEIGIYAAQVGNTTYNKSL